MAEKVSDTRHRCLAGVPVGSPALRVGAASLPHWSCNLTGEVVGNGNVCGSQVGDGRLISRWSIGSSAGPRRGSRCYLERLGELEAFLGA